MSLVRAGQSEALPAEVLPAAIRVGFAPPRIEATDIEAIAEVLRSGWLTTGPRVRELEAAVARYTGARYAVAVNSGTAALHLSLLAAGAGPQCEVVTTPFTFCATLNAILHTGAAPVLADVDLTTMNLDPSAAAAAITPRAMALLPVHFAGRPAAMTAFRALAHAHDLRVVEDAAHAFGAAIGDSRVGVLGDLTAFSFHAVKNLTTGEGGMVTTDHEPWARRMRTMALHGLSADAWARYSGTGTPHYEVVEAGFKYNMMDLQAALGLQQLARFDDLQSHRETLWIRYETGLAGLPLTQPAPADPGTTHARHLFTILVDRDLCGWTRDDLAAALRARGIATSVHFRALHLHRYYAERFGWRPGQFPNAEFISARTLSLPLSAGTCLDDVDRVVEAMHELVR